MYDAKYLAFTEGSRIVVLKLLSVIALALFKLVKNDQYATKHLFKFFHFAADI